MSNQEKYPCECTVTSSAYCMTHGKPYPMSKPEEKKCEIDPIKFFHDWDLKEWLISLGSFPVEVVSTKNFGGSYERRMAHVLKLENKKFATIIEEGCSCYSASQAKIEVHPDKKTAMNVFNSWVKEKESYL